MYVLRVEGRDGYGMYSSNDGYVPWDNCIRRNPCTHRDIVRYLDVGRGRDGNVRHGFSSFDMMWRWFHENADNVRCVLSWAVLCVYEVQEEYSATGICQFIWHVDHGRKVAELSVDEFFWLLANGAPIPEPKGVVERIKHQVTKPIKAWVQFKEAPKSARKYA